MSPRELAITGTMTTGRCSLWRSRCQSKTEAGRTVQGSLPIPDSDNGRICWNIVDHLCLQHKFHVLRLPIPWCGFEQILECLRGGYKLGGCSGATLSDAGDRD